MLAASSAGAAGASRSTGAFTCTACTLVNTSGERCEACGTFRDDNAAWQAAQANEWQVRQRLLKETAAGNSWCCTACTFVNPLVQGTCQICGQGTKAAADEAMKTASSLSSSAVPAAVTAAAAAPAHRKKRRKLRNALDGSSVSEDDSDPPTGGSDASDGSSGTISASISPMMPLPLVSPALGRAIMKAKRAAPTSSAYPAAAAPSVLTVATSSGTMPSTTALAAAFAGAEVSAGSSASKGRKGSSSKKKSKVTTSPAAVPAAASNSGTAAAPAPSAAAASSSSAAASASLTGEDSLTELTEGTVLAYHARFVQMVTLQAKSKPASSSSGAAAASSSAAASSERKEPDSGGLTAGEQRSILACVQDLFAEINFRADSAAAKAAREALRLQPTVNACQVCYADFAGGANVDEDETAVPARMETCGHAQTCTDCFRQFVQIKVRDGAVMPWLMCPAEKCCHPLAPNDLAAALTSHELAQLAAAYMRKRLVRSQAFVPCKTSGCQYGFAVPLTKAGNVPKNGKKLTCALCNVEQSVQRGKDGELDDYFKKMVAERKLRPCPKCAWLTDKEFGVCNVICCSKCGVWWNWRTNDTGKDSATLKNKARMNHSLWEPGVRCAEPTIELQFQQNLEHSNPKEFKALLERNGQKYDPKYVRGH